jgi:hypothetical protein
MSNTRILSVGMLLFCSHVCAHSTQSIEMINNSPDVIHLAAKAADNSFSVNQRVPAYSKAFIISKIVELDTLQERLFLAIFRDSVQEIEQAIADGANVKKAREGKTPLAWALSFNMVNAATCLMKHGAK